MARSTKGRIFKRGKKRRYYVQFYLNGKQIVKALKDENGDPITDKTKALRARDRLLAPYVAKDEVQRRQQAVAALETAEVAAEEADELLREKLRLSDAWDKFHANPERPQCSDTMLTDYERRWCCFADWMAENHSDTKAMESVTPQHAREFITSLDDGETVQDKDGNKKTVKISANRRNKILQGCRLVFRVLHEDCNGMRNPFRNIRNRQQDTKGHRELSEGELLQVCQKAEGELRTLFAIGLYTAMRLGDACLLKWEDSKLHTNRISIVPRKTRRTGKTLVIPIHPVLRSILQETPRSDRVGYVVPELAERYKRDTSSVCKIIRKHFQDTCGIKTQERHEGQKNATCRVGFHSLRHSFVSMCAAKGVPLPVVQELCGHGSPAVQRHYIHLGPEAAESALTALPSINGDADADKEQKARDRLHSFADNLPIDKLQKVIEYAESL